MNPTLERILSETDNPHEAAYMLRIAGYDPELFYLKSNRDYGFKVRMSDQEFRVVRGLDWDVQEIK